MNFEHLKDHIDNAMGGHPFVKSARLEWHHDLGRVEGEFVLIIESKREITLSGGNGHNGLDAKDADTLYAAVNSVLIVEGAIGRVKRIIVR